MFYYKFALSVGGTWGEHAPPPPPPPNPASSIDCIYENHTPKWCLNVLSKVLSIFFWKKSSDDFEILWTIDVFSKDTVKL